MPQSCPQAACAKPRPTNFDRCIAVNLHGAYLVSRAIVPQMIELRKGSIIHMASVTGVIGLPGLAVSSATKGAFNNLAGGPCQPTISTWASGSTP